MKECNRCKQDKEACDFSVDNRAKDGLQTRCKACQSIVKSGMKEYYRERHLQNKYGISSEDYSNMLKEQDNKCAICGIEEKYCEHQRLAVDHDHETQEVRKLLCKKCNQGIGLLQDNSEFAYNAYKYLKEFNK